jgi:hypothetical protein
MNKAHKRAKLALQNHSEGFRFRRVMLESPLAGYGTPYAGQTIGNTRYARACVRDSLTRGEAPFASHLIYAQPGVLNDKNESEREYGITAGHAWLAMAMALVVYKDRGISNGMKRAINIAEAMDKPIEYRELGPDWDQAPLEWSQLWQQK